MTGKIAVVTGAASGIGRETALLLARQGASVAATDLDATGAEATARAILEAGGRAIALKLDVTSEADWEAAVAQVTNRWNCPSVLVASAGIAFAKPVTETRLEDWRRVMAVNLDGVFLGIKHILGAMRQARAAGSIVIVSSVSGMRAFAGASAYGASKAAVRFLAKVVALECAENGDNIRVNAVVPGAVITPMWRTMDFFQDLVAKHGSEEGAWKALGAYPEASPLKRFATAAEVARAILYLASDESAFVNGTELVVDGGAAG